MCRFTLYLGEPILLRSLLVEPRNSLVHQSLHSPLPSAPVHGDGFGVAWYQPGLSPEPAVFRCVTPAWSSDNLRHLARVTESPAILAHVRAASAGSTISETNCHPFVAGRLAFCHNGYLASFGRVRRRLSDALGETTYGAIQGSTDSEYLFALFREQYGRTPGPPGAAKLGEALRATLATLEDFLAELEVEEASFLNLAVTDGEAAAACRLSTGDAPAVLSLFVCTGKRYSIESGRCQLADSAEGEGAVLISSEALCGDERWQEVPPGHMVLADRRGALEVVPLDPPRARAPRTAA